MMMMMRTTRFCLAIVFVIGFSHGAYGQAYYSEYDLAENDVNATAVCDVCHLRYYHKEVSTPDILFMGGNTTACNQYELAACCTEETAENILNDVLYGEYYHFQRCGPLSPKCLKFFESEACLYECSVHAGKYRKFRDCDELATGGGNVWEIFNMPLAASSCDAWYDACRDDLFCVGPSRNFFDEPEKCDVETDCQPFKEIYRDGKDMCSVLFGTSFVYEENEEDAYPLLFDEDVNLQEMKSLGLYHPYDLIQTSVSFPEQCDFITGDKDKECEIIDV